MTKRQKDLKRKRLIKAYSQAPLGSAKYFEILRKLEALEAQPVSDPGTLRTW